MERQQADIRVTYIGTTKNAFYLPEGRRVVSKRFTQRIKYNNLNVRIRLKRLEQRTIYFSKLGELHDKVMGEFVSREHYQLV